MTTHTDLIKRLRALKGPARLAAADAIESLEKQVAAQQAQMYEDRRQALVWRDQVAALRVDAERLQFFYNKMEVRADGWVSEAIFIQQQDGGCDLGDAIDAAMGEK